MNTKPKVKTSNLNIRVAPKELESMKQVASKLGLSVSAYLLKLNERECQRLEIEQAS